MQTSAKARTVHDEPRDKKSRGHESCRCTQMRRKCGEKPGGWIAPGEPPQGPSVYTRPTAHPHRQEKEITPMNPSQGDHTQDTPADGGLTAHPAVSLLCWHCGSAPQEKGSKICRGCRRAGIDPLFIPCTAHGWDHVAKRTGPGRHLFTCKHPDRPLTAEID